MGAWCKICDFYEADSTEPLYQCSRCTKMLETYPELAEWIRDVAARAVQKHESSYRHDSRDWD